MQPVMTVKEASDFESALANRGLNPAELMSRAGAVVAMQAADLVDTGSVVVFCGMGNNGGDGWVAADNLARYGVDVAVVCPATPAMVTKLPAKDAARKACEMGVPIHVAPERDELDRLLGDADVVIDACFGIGFRGAMPEPYASWVAAVDEVFLGQVVSVDVPSGIDAETGMASGPHFTADCTVTMFAAKPGLVSGLGREASGEIVVAALVGTEQGVEDIGEAAGARLLDEADYLDIFPEASRLQDKYSRGRVLVVAGSTRFPGAAVMAAISAARAGSGYVTLAVPDPVVPVAQAHLLSIPVVGLAASPMGTFSVGAVEEVRELASHADAILAGPGMTTGDGACEVVRTLLGTDRALVLDADALNLLVRICAGTAEGNPQALRREAPLVLTPHRRELARLLGGDMERTASLSGSIEGAEALAWAVGSSDFAVVAKGETTAVAGVDTALIVEPGPAALATAGTGDVLAGICAGTLAQRVAQAGPGDGLGADELCLLMAGADRVHAVAGELACLRCGSRGVMATDVADLVGLAFDELQRRAEEALVGEGEEDVGEQLERALEFEDETRVEPSVEAQAARHAAATAAAWGQDDEPLEEPETPEQQSERLARAKRAANARRQRLSTSRAAPVPGEAGLPGGQGSGAVLADETTEIGLDAASWSSEGGFPDGGGEVTQVMPVVGSAEPAGPDEPTGSAGEGQDPAEAKDAAADEGQSFAEAAAADGAANPANPSQPAQPAGDLAVPPFLAGVYQGGVAADGPAEDDDLEDGAEPEPEPESNPSSPLEQFHRRATKHTGVTPAVPPEDRPSVTNGRKGRRDQK